MARAYLLSHGARIGDQPDTFVPAGRTIAFYSEFDENTLRLNGLAALNNGDIQPTETLVGPCEVANYYHPRFEDEAIAEHLASESSASGGVSYYVGDQLPDPSWLCTTPADCRKTYPQHGAKCGGVFRRITEAEIYSVACRGLRGAKNAATQELAGTTDLNDETTAEGQRLLDWKDTDPAAAIAYWQSLTQATQMMIAASAPGWAFQKWANQYFAGAGVGESEAVVSARRYLEATDEDTFFNWVYSLNPNDRQRQMILGDKALAEVFERKLREPRERLGLPDTSVPSTDQYATTAQTVQQQMATLAVAIDQLTGSEADGNAVAEVSQLYVAIMGEVQSLQQLAGEDRDRLKNAVGAESVGADLGVGIATYQEVPDEENLANLRTGTAGFHAWVAALV